MQTEELALFNAANWAVLGRELIRYAEMKTFAKVIRSVSALPEGKEPADIALVAIQKTLEWICTGVEGQGSRRWNRELNPELLDHLKDAVDSEISNLIQKKEHVSTNYSSKADEKVAAQIYESSVDEAAEPPQMPDEILQAATALPSDEDLLKAYLTEMYAMFQAKGDDDATLVLMSFEEQSKGDGIPKHLVVAEQTGMKIEAVRNAVKRIRSTALAVRENVKRRLGHEQ